MTTVEHIVTLRSAEHYGRRVPAQAFGAVVGLIPAAVRQSILMAFQGRSVGRGQRPRWLQAASDVRFMGHDGSDETRLYFEAPRLGEAAAQVYEKNELWPHELPPPAETGFHLLSDVLTEISAGQADSAHFDRPLLHRVGKFRSAFKGYFQELTIGSQRAGKDHDARIDRDVLDKARSLWRSTPSSHQVRVSGKLDMLRISTQSFALRLEDGAEVRGVLAEGDLSDVKGLLNCDVVALGKAVFRPSGRLLRVDASEIAAATQRDRLFSRMPRPRTTRLDVRDVLHQQVQKGGVAAILGKWPGDESDEQIERALQELG